MSIGPLSSVSQAGLLQRSQAVSPSNDADADDKTAAPVGNAPQAPRANDGDADDALGTAPSRFSKASQAALLQLQAGN